MSFAPLPFDAPLADYERQAEALLRGWREGDAEAMRVFRHKHPRFLDERIPWLPKRLTDEDARNIPVAADDARLAVARGYDFADWQRLGEHVAAVARPGSPVARFEAAVEAAIDGDAATLGTLLEAHPGLVRARSARVTHFDPPVHQATLLHYLAANGVEGYRQRSPKNAVEIATMLLRAGAEVDALAGCYGGRHTTMSMLVSSEPPARAGVQVPLVETLLDFGADVEGRGEGNWTAPLATALVFSYREAAEALVRRGARVDDLPKAAGLGRLDDARRLLDASDAGARHRALALAAQLGHAEAVRLLLDAGEDPDRYNPEGFHAHSTPLHQAALGGHADVVRLLVERGARLDIRDAIYDGTPLAWAEYGGRSDIVAYLRGRGTPDAA